MSLIHYEDFAPGETRTYGAYGFTEEAIIAFAAEYDAQTFHMDAELAKHTLLGGLAASGWHTCSALMRMMVDDWLGASACLAGIGIEDNRWLAPVRPGDVLTRANANAGKDRSAFAARRRHRQVRDDPAQPARRRGDAADRLHPVRAA